MGIFDKIKESLTVSYDRLKGVSIRDSQPRLLSAEAENAFARIKDGVGIDRMIRGEGHGH